MKSIMDTAMAAANKVVMVAFDVDPWQGDVRLRMGNLGDQDAIVSVIPGSFCDEISKAKFALYANLRAYSSTCRDGRCVPKRRVVEWFERHKSLASVLSAIMEDIVSQMASWEEALRAGARGVATSRWKLLNGESSPPPSYLLAAENSAVAAMPAKKDIIGSFRVPVRLGMHSFACMGGGLDPDIDRLISHDDKVEAAWHAIDELLAAPYRAFAEAMEGETAEAKPGERLDHKLERMVRDARRFLNTELVGDVKSIDAARDILRMLDGEGACCVDWRKARTLAAMAADSSMLLSSVDGVMAVV